MSMLVRSRNFDDKLTRVEQDHRELADEPASDDRFVSIGVREHVAAVPWPVAAFPHPAATGLPVEEVIDELRTALAGVGAAVLQAEPGAGKTTVVPLRLLGEPWMDGDRMLLLEPRRVAARAAAARMASAKPTISSTVSPFIRKAMSSPAI